MKYTSIEICAGAGGQAIGLEKSGFEHVCLVEIDNHACNTLKLNRPNWNVNEMDLFDFSSKAFKGIDLLAGGVPCPPFSIAGRQLGENDERDLFPVAIRLIRETKPKAILLENVRGLMSNKFDSYRDNILKSLDRLGYKAEWKILNAQNFGVPQSRPRALLIGFQKKYFPYFNWPIGTEEYITVGEAIYNEMKLNGWKNAKEWKSIANKVGPTLVGGSKKHGGADLGPTRAKKSWLELGIDGTGIADSPPEKEFKGKPKLTNSMAARIQGFPDDWVFSGKKTSIYRQIGNAFPPPMAYAIGLNIIETLNAYEKNAKRKEKQRSSCQIA